MNKEDSGSRAARHAREILRDLSPDMVLDFVRTKQDDGELNRLYEVIEPAYLKDTQRLKEIEKQLEAILLDEKSRKLFDEYAVIRWSDHCVQQTVFFHLGFAAAMRLIGTVAPPPKLRAVG